MDTKKTDWLDLIKNFIVIALIAVVVNLPFFYLLNQKQTKVGVIDVQTLLIEYEKKVTAELYANQSPYQQSGDVNSNTAEIEKKTKQFLQKLEGTIEEINSECNCVIINKAALLTQSGKVTDYTGRVREALNK